MIFLSICEYINFHDVPAGFNAVLTFSFIEERKDMSIILSNPGTLANELKVINHLNGFSVSILCKAYITQALAGQMLQLWCRMLLLASANHILLFYYNKRDACVYGHMHPNVPFYWPTLSVDTDARAKLCKGRWTQFFPEWNLLVVCEQRRF